MRYFSLRYPQLLTALLLVGSGFAASAAAQSDATTDGPSDSALALDQWHYVQVDSSRDRWGDYAEPDWLRYFGLDTGDLNGDGHGDLLAGRHVYLSRAATLPATGKKSTSASTSTAF